MAVNNLVKILALTLVFAGAFDFGFSYDRPPRRKSLSKPLLKDLEEYDPASPQQVSIYTILFSPLNFLRFIPLLLILNRIGRYNYEILCIRIKVHQTYH